MRIVDRYSHAGADAILRESHVAQLTEVEIAILAIDGESCRVKPTRERARTGLLYSPRAINYCLLQKQLYRSGWQSAECRQTFREHFPDTGTTRRIPLSMDGLKNRVGLESQLAKYAFLEYDVLAKMPIYERLGLIAVGIEIVQVYRLAREMSSGVGDFERLVTNLRTRGERAGDFPVLVIGIDVDAASFAQQQAIRFEGEIPIQSQGNRPGPPRFDEDDAPD